MRRNELPSVLIVEDESLIRMDAVDMIVETGFRTYEADSADQAILFMDRAPGRGVASG